MLSVVPPIWFNVRFAEQYSMLWLLGPANVAITLQTVDALASVLSGLVRKPDRAALLSHVW